MDEPDYDKFIHLFKSVGIEYKEEIFKDTKIIKCEEGCGKIEGYTMFYTDFEFDIDGNFISMGAWE